MSQVEGVGQDAFVQVEVGVFNIWVLLEAIYKQGFAQGSGALNAADNATPSLTEIRQFKSYLAHTRQ